MPKVLITGGSGVLGSELAPRFAAAGYDVRIMSRRPAPADTQYQWAQADLMTGEGLAAAVAGTDLIVHCATNNVRTKSTDVRGTKRLLDAARAAGTAHLFYISIVGIDRIPLGYYKAKLAAERLIEESGVPYSILRATQFHTLLDGFLSNLIRLPAAVLPKSFQFQLIDAGEVAEHMVADAASGPSGRLPDLGGPEVLRFDEIARLWLKARRKRALVLPLPLFGRIATGFRNGYNCAPDHAEGKITWADWLAKKYGGRM